ncbi:MAG TPA: rhodanese-like domain-containing protein [Povalibacter sp.]|nr:rhodanese-like domain-containing protein [Povalibacter sp.]
MPSTVTRIAPADSATALQHFESALRLETDCWDVHEAMARGEQDFVLLDVRSHESYDSGHVPNAVSLPHRKIIESTIAAYAPGTVFVVYCAGPHCNGAHRGAIRLAQLGRPVKLMIGGITGWLDEGFPLSQETTERNGHKEHATESA